MRDDDATTSEGGDDGNPGALYYDGAHVRSVSRRLADRRDWWEASRICLRG